MFNVSPMDTVLLMIYTGVRIGELLSIEKEDVHIKERYIVVKGTKTANAMRYVPIHEDLVDIVEKCSHSQINGLWRQIQERR